MSEPITIDEEEVTRQGIAIGERAARLAERLQRAGGSNVAILAVTKGHPIEVAVAALRAGFPDLGENYAQDLRVKADVLRNCAIPARWHFIGQLQTNKVRLIADYVSVWQSIDRCKVGIEVAKRAPRATVFAQVNLSGDPQKAGCSFDEVDQLVEDLRAENLEVAGLMGVGTADNDVETATGFRRLRSTVDRLGLDECSMGMSADLEIAVAEGSTMVRVGSDLFGPRS